MPGSRRPHILYNTVFRLSVLETSKLIASIVGHVVLDLDDYVFLSRFVKGQEMADLLTGGKRLVGLGLFYDRERLVSFGFEKVNMYFN